MRRVGRTARVEFGNLGALGGHFQRTTLTDLDTRVQSKIGGSMNVLYHLRQYY